MERKKITIISAKLFLVTYVLTSCSTSSLSALSGALDVANSILRPSYTPSPSTTQLTTTAVPNTSTSVASSGVNCVSDYTHEHSQWP